tara:strand:+ start:6351 stop:7454 length:1104 start_codon:yes stop_codon:yes gene_type:complete
MASLDDIIIVNITKATQTQSRQSFSNILIVGPNPSFSGRIQFYSTSTSGLASLAGDLTGGTGAPEYVAASAIAAQSPRVTQFAVGREDGGDADMTATLTAISLESNDWFGLVITDRTAATQQLAANYAASNKKVFACASSDANIVDQAQGVDVTSIAALLQNAGNNNAIVFYKADAASKFSDAAFLGRTLALDPGTYTGNLKSLNAETIDNLTDTQSKNVLDKNANTYEEVASRNVVRESKMSGGEFFDVIVFENYLIARIQEDQFALLASQNKVPFDDTGISQVQDVLNTTLANEQSEEDGQPRGITANKFDPDTKEQTGGFYTIVPLAADIPTVDKANRELNGVEFTAWLSGAIHKETINGFLVL